jgi:NADP-dependent 3-hydroxy acid dehydrogenase YdfG
MNRQRSKQDWERIMAGQAAFITGGASGIGLAVARDLAARGWLVGLADINAAALEAVKADFPGRPPLLYPMDVRDRAQWDGAMEDFARASGGRLDFLFNNAGVAIGGALGTSDMAEVDRAIAINLNGVVNGARAAYPLLKATPRSAMLITSSAAGIAGNADMSIYAATKFAVRGLAEALNGEWRRDGIFVGTLMPSFIETPLLNHVIDGSNRSVRESVRGAGLEITPVQAVADAAWYAIQKRDRVHTPVGKTAKRLWFMARWFPGTLRKLTGKSMAR